MTPASAYHCLEINKTFIRREGSRLVNVLVFFVYINDCDDIIGNVVCPILITSTHEVGNVRDYVVQYALKNGLVEDWLVPLVGETYDGMFNDPSQPHIKYALTLPT